MSKSILIIDDDPVIRELLFDFFSSKGFYVNERSNCSSLIDTPDELLKYDALIVDFNMPYLNGTQFIKKIREKIPNTLIIGISSSEDVSDSFLEAGANYFFLKPFKMLEILNTIKKHLHICSEDY